MHPMEGFENWLKTSNMKLELTPNLVQILWLAYQEGYYQGAISAWEIENAV